MILHPRLGSLAVCRPEGLQQASDVVELLERAARGAQLAAEPGTIEVHPAVPADVAPVRDRLRPCGHGPEEHDARDQRRQQDAECDERLHGTTAFRKTTYPAASAPIAIATSRAPSSAARPAVPSRSRPKMPAGPSTSSRSERASVPSTRACSTGLSSARTNTCPGRRPRAIARPIVPRSDT